MYRYVFWNRVVEINGVSANYFNDQYPTGEIALFQEDNNKTLLIVYGCPPFFNTAISHGDLVTYCEALLTELNKEVFPSE